MVLLNLMEKLGSAYELSYIIISIFNFLIFKHFSNQITLKPSLAQKLELLFKFSTIIEQINVPLWTHMVPLCLPLVMFYYSWCKPSVLFAMIDKFTTLFIGRDKYDWFLECMNSTVFNVTKFMK